jgi:hypothetical protein
MTYIIKNNDGSTTRLRVSSKTLEHVCSECSLEIKKDEVYLRRKYRDYDSYHVYFYHYECYKDLKPTAISNNWNTEDKQAWIEEQPYR